jgi:hypothetical protein
MSAPAIDSRDAVDHQRRSPVKAPPAKNPSIKPPPRKQPAIEEPPPHDVPDSEAPIGDPPPRTPPKRVDCGDGQSAEWLVRLLPPHHGRARDATEKM